MKWRFEDASRYFEREGLPKTFEKLYDDICLIIAKTFIAADEKMCEPINRSPKTRNVSFELFGFDILIDSDLKPWLLEVGQNLTECNVGPSMNQDSEVDRLVKVPLVTDMTNLLCLKPFKRLSANQKLNKTGQRLISGYGKSRTKMTTPKEIHAMTKENYRNILKAEDYLILFEFADEFSRRGNFRLAFPTPDKVEALQGCFEIERTNNLLLWKYLQWRSEGFDLLEEVSQFE